MPGKLLIGFIGAHALANGFHHLTDLDKLIADYFVILVKSKLGNITLGQIKIPCALFSGCIGCSNHASETLAKVFETCADRKPIFRESTLASAVNDLKEQLAHCGVNCIAHEVSIERFEYGLAGEDLCGHCCRMGHTAAADGFNERFFNNTVFNIQRELTCTLLGCASADAVSETADIADFFCFYPFTLFGNGSRFMLCALADTAHVLNFLRVFHLLISFLDL